MKYVFFPHGGSGNHGCEAIVRTTKKILKSDDITLFTFCEDEDIRYLGKEYISIKRPGRDLKKGSFEYYWVTIKQKLHLDIEAPDKSTFSPIIDVCDKHTVLVSIGGDNYCYGENEYIYLVNREVKKRGTKLVLWGCSVEPEAISEKMEKDLASYDLITAREELTYNALKKINPNTVLVTDPAFILEKSPADYPEGLKDKKYIGINFGPTIERRESEKGIVKQSFRAIIDYILENTDYNVALIPHVVRKGLDDRQSLAVVYADYKQTGRVFFVKDQNCEQLKDIISGCEFFIGARTHSTIAAYSTCVPTLVLGYSVKARGIAKALFGTDEKYVLPVQSLKDEKELLNAFISLFEKRNEIKAHLQEIMPEYIEKSYIAGEKLEELIDG